MYVGRLGGPGGALKVAEAARAAVRSVELHRPIDLLLNGMVNRITDGMSGGAAPLRTALQLMCTNARGSDGEALRWVSLGLAIVQEVAAGELWDDAIWFQLADEMVRHARGAGALAVLPSALVFLAGTSVCAGEFGTAATLIEEATSIAAATDHLAPMRYHSLSLATFRDNPTDVLPVIEAAAEGEPPGVKGVCSA